jgi:hypothetical protein
MKKFILIFVLACGALQAQPLVVRDGIRSGNRPGLVIAAFMGEPSVEGNRITGSFLTDPDSAGQRDILLNWPLIVDWSRIDTLRVDSLPRRPVLMIERLAAGVFFDGEITDSLVQADSLWRRSIQ